MAGDADIHNVFGKHFMKWRNTKVMYLESVYIHCLLKHSFAIFK